MGKSGYKGYTIMTESALFLSGAQQVAASLHYTEMLKF